MRFFPCNVIHQFLIKYGPSLKIEDNRLYGDNLRLALAFGGPQRCQPCQSKRTSGDMEAAMSDIRGK